MSRLHLVSVAALTTISLAGCSANSITGQATIGPSARDAPAAPEVTVTFDGKPLPLRPGGTCIGDGENILITSKFDGATGKLMADVSIQPALAAHTVQLKGADQGHDYFWETTSTGGEVMTVTKEGKTVTVRGRIPRLKDSTYKRSIEIKAVSCPGV